MNITSKLLNSIVETVNELPPELPHIIKLAEEEARGKFGDEIKGGHVVSVIIFLRWICPALVSPVEFDLIKSISTLTFFPPLI